MGGNDYYAKALQSALGVPVGIINNAKAGKAIQEFMPEGSFNTDTGTIYTTGAVYNELLIPFFDYTFKGIVWYQGEQDYWNKN